MAGLKLRPLVMSVKTTNWRQNDDYSEEADADFHEVRSSILDRDKNTCQFCAFKAKKWQEVHHINGDHGDNSKDNLITTCMFCHSCHHIGLAGTKQEGELVWIPEFSQIQLNHLVRSILVAVHWYDQVQTEMNSKPDMLRSARDIQESARVLFAEFKSRREHAKEKLGLSEPDKLANILLKLPDEVYSRRAEILNGIRLLPTGSRILVGKDYMPDIVSSWLQAGGPYASFRPSTWTALLRTSL